MGQYIGLIADGWQACTSLHKHTHAHTRAHTRTHTRTHARTHTHTHTHTRTHTRARTHTHTRTHTQVHTHTHTHTHRLPAVLSSGATQGSAYAVRAPRRCPPAQGVQGHMLCIGAGISGVHSTHRCAGVQSAHRCRGLGSGASSAASEQPVRVVCLAMGMHKVLSMSGGGAACKLRVSLVLRRGTAGSRPGAL